MRSIHITRENHNRLHDLLIATGTVPDRDREVLKELEAELGRAQVVPAEQLPADVVTMHSKARILDLDTGEEMLFTLAFPEEADIDQGRLSVLAPLGTAILGYRAGDTFNWKVPAGVRNLKVLEVVFQPEANGQEAA